MAAATSVIGHLAQTEFCALCSWCCRKVAQAYLHFCVVRMQTGLTYLVTFSSETVDLNIKHLSLLCFVRKKTVDQRHLS